MSYSEHVGVRASCSRMPTGREPGTFQLGADPPDDTVKKYDSILEGGE